MKYHSATLVNSETKQFAFKVFTFDDTGGFDRLNRLSNYTILLVEKGTGTLNVDFSSYSFASGYLLCFSPYQPFKLDADEPIVGAAVHFHPDFFCIHKHQQEVACNGLLFNNIYQPPLFSLTEDDKAALSQLLTKMQTELELGGLAQCELLVSYLKIFLITASRIKTERLPGMGSITTKEPFLLHRLKDAIENHYRSTRSASDYAIMLEVSVKTLAKATKTHFNKTLTDLITERIIIEAKRELYLTSKPVKVIAYELGFDDEHYFSRFFKVNAEVSPQTYRETVALSGSTSQ